jgi:hypothetical protein
MLTDLLGNRPIALFEFLPSGLRVGNQALGRRSQQVIDLRGQIGLDLLQPRPLGGEELLGA